MQYSLLLKILNEIGIDDFQKMIIFSSTPKPTYATGKKLEVSLLKAMNSMRMAAIT